MGVATDMGDRVGRCVLTAWLVRAGSTRCWADARCADARWADMLGGRVLVRGRCWAASVMWASVLWVGEC